MFNMADIIRLIFRIIDKLPITLTIMIASLFLGLLLGLLLAAVKIKQSRIPNAIVTVYVSFMRCTPPLVQLFLVFYGLPQLLMLFNININDWDPVIFAIITFSMNSAAFLSEVMRSAYLAVDRGQQEAALSVGMSNIQSFISIILPQAFGIALPNLGNNLIILLKETSLAFTIGITDIMGQVNIICANSQGVNQLEIYLIIALIYWVICIAIEKGIAFLEHNYTRGHIGIAS